MNTHLLDLFTRDLFCGGWVGGGGVHEGASTALNKLKNDRELSEVRSSIEITATPCSGPGQFLTLVGYSSVLPNIAEAIQFTTVVLSCLIQKITHGIILYFYAMHCGHHH